MSMKKVSEPKKLTKQQQIIRDLSDRIVHAQKPIRILDALKWDNDIRDQFFAKKCRALPKVTKDYYQLNKLKFKPDELKEEFRNIDRLVQQKLGQFGGVGAIMQDRCREYVKAIELLEARGSKEFALLSAELYGSAKDVFYAGGPKVSDLSATMAKTLTRLKKFALTDLDEKKYTAKQAAKILNSRLKQYFTHDDHNVSVMVSNKLVADAAAGADKLKLRSDAMFSAREIRMLEVHEGWVHLATTFNGMEQPICTFLSKGPPSSAVTQEGLAVITEIVTFASYPTRVKKITDRITAISMVENGADFMDIFRYFKEEGFTIEDSYQLTSRIFRGSVPKGGPFTKDLSYGKGFILVFNYLRLAVQQGLLHNIPALFVGKTKIENLQRLTELMQDGLISAPHYMPPQFRDIAALSSWLSFSVFMNEIELEKFSENYREILHPINKPLVKRNNSKKKLKP